jgi:hypothetical protein
MWSRKKGGNNPQNVYRGLSTLEILLILALTFGVSTGLVYFSQSSIEEISGPSSSIIDAEKSLASQKVEAEIKQIRSNTLGSLFWLKMIGIFVTVGGAVGGYLVAQSRASQAKIEFDNRRNTDSAYQDYLNELSSESPLLRAAAAVKLGDLLESFPYEWNVNSRRREQIIDLTKKVLAASLAIEEEPKVQKTLSSALVKHHPWESDPNTDLKNDYSDLRQIDLSGARASDAYWARVDFTYADFYRANLSNTSFRKSILQGAQFREAILREAVLIDADCSGANFNHADLRNSNLTGALCIDANFDGAKVYGMITTNTQFGNLVDVLVDNSPNADGSILISLKDLLSKTS